MAFECPRRSSPPSPMFDADTGCIATDPAPSARRRFRSKTGIENLPANEHAQETPHTPSPTRTTRRIQSGCAGSRPRLRDGMPGSPSQHIDITRAKWIPYFSITKTVRFSVAVDTPRAPQDLAPFRLLQETVRDTAFGRSRQSRGVTRTPFWTPQRQNRSIRFQADQRPVHQPNNKRQKNDAADAEAICKAASRPTMTFVAVKTAKQQARGMLFRTRDLLVRQGTQTINALRGHLAEFGVVAPHGAVHVGRLASALDDPDLDFPETVREITGLLLEQIAGLGTKIDSLEEEILAAARQDEEVRRLMTVPGSARSPRWRFRPSRRRWRPSSATGTLPPGSAWCRASTRPAASRSLAGYRRWASAI